MAVGLTYHPRLYLGEGMKRKKLDKIKKRLEKRPMLSGMYLITLSENKSDQLEIYAARQLSQSYYSKYPPFVIGIAKSRKDAVALVEQIVRECLAKRGDCALKEYLQC
jgi:hypothetical protein